MANQQGAETLPRYSYGSFAEKRNGSRAKWFVDGQDYMSAVADAIDSAKKEIFITDWQMNPYIFMKRPDTGVVSLDCRLDTMLFKKANEDVRVYILLYQETRGILNLGNAETEKLLKSHPKIEVYRHPNWRTFGSHPSVIKWSPHEKMVIVDRSIAFVGGIDLCYGRWDTHRHELMDDYPTHSFVNGEQRSQESNGRLYSRWIGKDYRNEFLNKKSFNWKKPFTDYEPGFDRSKVPRMPWHDVACAFTGDAVYDAVKHFIQRYSAVTNDKSKFADGTVSRLPRTKIASLLSGSYDNLSIQVLRSVSEWSANQPHEASIYNAYREVIANAEHFIYIENQFFISSQPNNVKNTIQSALTERIIRAKNQSDDFHVMIIMPLKPEFGPENWESGHAPCLNSLTYWNNATLANGEHSLLQKLKGQMSDEEIKSYFSVYGLRTYGRLGGTNVETEIVYVHSKLMIVDDRITIIGSANINDRSMLGERDSEVAVIVEDDTVQQMIDGEMNGIPYKKSRFSHSLRCQLLNEHLGQLNTENNANALGVEDPLARAFLQGISEQSEDNTKMFEEIFSGSRTLPTDKVLNFKKLKEWNKRTNQLTETERARRLRGRKLRKIKGHTTIIPTLFLNEELKPSSRLGRDIEV